jgi:hypothetical protein
MLFEGNSVTILVPGHFREPGKLPKTSNRLPAMAGNPKNLPGLHECSEKCTQTTQLSSKKCTASAQLPKKSVRNQGGLPCHLLQYTTAQSPPDATRSVSKRTGDMSLRDFSLPRQGTRRVHQEEREEHGVDLSRGEGPRGIPPT